MILFLVLYWCSAVAGGILGDNSRASRFGVFNSRLRPNKFPFRVATGIGAQVDDLAHRFRGINGGFAPQSTKFPVRREKPGILPPPRPTEPPRVVNTLPGKERPLYSRLVSSHPGHNHK